jgi:CubicO group peptidase (beta-lactamase class C family)
MNRTLPTLGGPRRHLLPSVSLLALAAHAACASAPEPREPAELAARQLSEPTELAEATVLQSPAGASVEIPAGWFFSSSEKVLHLEAPERDLDLWLVDVPGASVEEAISAAWAIVRPDFDRQTDDVLTPPAQGGWDALRQELYQTAAEEARVILAIARRKGDTTYVMLVDGAAAALDRRGAHFGQILGSQKPADLLTESLAEAEAAPLSGERAAAFDAFIEQARELLEIPGAAVAVVQGGEIVFEGGYGVRGPGGEPVRPETAFMIGSVNKPLTSLMLAVAVDRGLASWTTPVVDLLPQFDLADTAMARRVELQHTMCACTGLPRQDFEFLFRFDGITTEERLAELATMAPTTGFGETFQYSNALVAAGGFAGARALAQQGSLQGAYVAAMREAVVGPLGLQATFFHPDEATRHDHALPFGRRLEGGYVPVPLSYDDAVVSVAPAGGGWSNVRDLAAYLRLELAEGALPGGERLLSREALFERRTPRVAISDESAYGLALSVSHRRDLLAIGHGGNTLGYTSLVRFFPDHDLGIAILTNAQAGNAFTGAIERRLIELVFDATPEAAQQVAFAAERRRELADQHRARLSAPFAGQWATPLLGRYANDALGELRLMRVGEDLIVDVGEWRAQAKRYSTGGSETLMLVEPPVAGLAFILRDGELLLDAGQQQYRFTQRL